MFLFLGMSVLRGAEFYVFTNTRSTLAVYLSRWCFYEKKIRSKRNIVFGRNHGSKCGCEKRMEKDHPRIGGTAEKTQELKTIEMVFGKVASSKLWDL